ncbi:natural cytotoxicity triggering receptor 3 ligand 1-like [Polypterus senegalus]|uniref:natural cytotoxicity triggering receptor 3 ligand 1-like n=1 Tax=Polypterus senegalus TaxID=55291 RepID=UPI001966AE1F|nr:natural cytotoxicity triggering receptor 3 ligand 1-like [Polypterus senegalus]
MSIIIEKPETVKRKEKRKKEENGGCGGKAGSSEESVFLSLADDLLLTPQSATRLIGQRLELNCSLNKEKNCKRPQFFWRHRHIHLNSSEEAEKDIRGKGRFSISTESLSSSLVITDLKVTDSGYFNCSVLCMTIKKEFIWKSSQLEMRAVPKLDLHYQTSSENPNILHLTCSAVGFYPPNITLFWDHSLHEVTHSILPDNPTLLQDGTYNISSILHVKTSLWSPGEEIGCVVNHSSLTRPLRKNITREGDLQENKNWPWYFLLLFTFPLLICAFLSVKRCRAHTKRDVPVHCAEVKFEKEDEICYASIQHTKQTKQDKKKERLCAQKADQFSPAKRKQKSSMNEDTVNYATLNFSHGRKI